MTSLLKRYGGSVLLLILAFAYVTRMYQLHIPEGYMFDEVYHAVTAKLISRNDPRAYEWWNPAPEPDTAVDWLHPPLAKLFQASSIIAFGENSFGWRFSSVLFGVLVIAVVYHLALEITKNEAVALTSAAVASLDGLLLVQSRIAMNDIHVTFFILLTLLAYLKYKATPSVARLLLTGVIAGLAIASKWSGVFALAVVWVFEALRVLHIWAQKKKGRRLNWKNILRQSFVYVASLILLPAVVYILSYSQMFLQGKNFNHFVELHHQIWYYQTHLKETHPYQSRPWQWALDIRPVWYYADYGEQTRGDIYAFGNPIIFWLGLGIVLFSGFEAFELVLRLYQEKRSVSSFFRSLLRTITNSSVCFLVTAYCMVWMPWQLSPRIMFFYHYTPAVPLLSILIGIVLVRWFKHKGIQRSIAIIFSTLLILAFIIWYPHWTGILVPLELKESVYFAFDTWR